MLALRLSLLLFVGSLLALLLIAVLLAKRDRKVLLSAIRALGCPCCSARLSEDSARVADEMWKRHVATLVQQNPGVRFRIVRQLAVVCGGCGARLQFDQNSRTLRAIAIVLSFETAGTGN